MTTFKCILSYNGKIEEFLVIKRSGQTNQNSMLQVVLVVSQVLLNWF